MIGVCIITVIPHRKIELSLPSTSRSRTVTTINIEKIWVIPSLTSIQHHSYEMTTNCMSSGMRTVPMRRLY
jgi:hypothetical protein